MSNAAELPVSPEHQEDEWLGSPSDLWSVKLGLELAIETSQ